MIRIRWTYLVLASIFPCWSASSQGYVKEQSGEPVKGATLLLTRNVSVSNNVALAFPLGHSVVFVGEANPPTEGEAWYHVTTDEAGHYKRGGIPSGRYNVQVFLWNREVTPCRVRSKCREAGLEVGVLAPSWDEQDRRCRFN